MSSDTARGCRVTGAAAAAAAAASRWPDGIKVRLIKSLSTFIMPSAISTSSLSLVGSFILILSV